MVELLTKTACPACGKEMRTLYVPDADINVDVCINGCGGVYFSKKEIWNFDNIKNSVDTILSQIKRRHLTEENENSARKCPSCGAKMVKFGIDGTDVQMDMCYSCGGRFLNYDALTRLCNTEHNIFDEQIDTTEDSVSREYYKSLSLPGSSSMRQQFEEWIKTHI